MARRQFAKLDQVGTLQRSVQVGSKLDFTAAARHRAALCALVQTAGRIPAKASLVLQHQIAIFREHRKKS